MEKTGKLETAQIVIMFRALVMAAIENLPDLGVGDEKLGYTTQEKIDEYKASIEKRLDKGLDKLAEAMIEKDATEVTKEVFVENLCKPENAKILTSYGFRQYILKDAKVAFASKGASELGAEETNQES